MALAASHEDRAVVSHELEALRSLSRSIRMSSQNPTQFNSFALRSPVILWMRVVYDGGSAGAEKGVDRVLSDDRVDALVVPIGKGELVCRRI